MTSAISSSVRPLVRAILKWMPQFVGGPQRDEDAQRDEAAVAATETLASPQPTEDVVDGRSRTARRRTRRCGGSTSPSGRTPGSSSRKTFNPVSRTSVMDPPSHGIDHSGARYPTGPDAMQTDSAAVFARTLMASPAPGSRTKTRLSPGCTGTLCLGAVAERHRHRAFAVGEVVDLGGPVRLAAAARPAACAPGSRAGRGSRTWGRDL